MRPKITRKSFLPPFVTSWFVLLWPILTLDHRLQIWILTLDHRLQIWSHTNEEQRLNQNQMKLKAVYFPIRNFKKLFFSDKKFWRTWKPGDHELNLTTRKKRKNYLKHISKSYRNKTPVKQADKNSEEIKKSRQKKSKYIWKFLKM